MVKYRIGQKVHIKSGSWEGGTYTWNGVIVSIKSHPGGYGLRKGTYYFVKPTKDSVDAVYDVDAQELNNEMANPSTYFTKSRLIEGWINSPGYD